MRFSKNFIYTRREIAEEIESVNGKLLLKANFIKQELAGVYSFQPLGLRVLNKIENIIRKHMNTISSEVFMPSLHPMRYWETTGRLEKVDVLMKTSGANAKSLEKNSQSYILGSTHEEVVTPLVGEFIKSYKDLPISVYQVQTKFRNEARAKSGLLRGREFRMKDMYSFHGSEEDFGQFYENVKQVYLNIFTDLGLGKDTYISLASGGDFTTKFSHEFQTILESGEDTIYLDRKNNIAYNSEIITEAEFDKLGVNINDLEKVKACEVGNIFPLESKFPDAFGIGYQDQNGATQKVIMGCYGIGSSRLMGVIVEKFNDAKGMMWPTQVAPFNIHLVTLAKSDSEAAYTQSLQLYNTLTASGLEVLWDDRLDAMAGEKFTDADLIGIPIRMVISEKSIAAGGVELKNRNSQESKIVSFDEALNTQL